MAEVSVVKMTPVDGGDSVDIPSGKTTIGRGTFLQVHSLLVVNKMGTFSENQKSSKILKGDTLDWTLVILHWIVHGLGCNTVYSIYPAVSAE